MTWPESGTCWPLATFAQYNGPGSCGSEAVERVRAELEVIDSKRTKREAPADTGAASKKNREMALDGQMIPRRRGHHQHLDEIRPHALALLSMGSLAGVATAERLLIDADAAEALVLCELPELADQVLIRPRIWLWLMTRRAA